MKNYLILISVFFISCGKSLTDLPQYDLCVEKSISIYPDSSYFSNVRCMQFYKEHIYILDANRRDVAILDTALHDISTIGREGRAANELLIAADLYIHNDTVFISDFGNGCIKAFYGPDYIRSTRFPFAVDKRFLCTDSDFILPTQTEDGIMMSVAKQGADSCRYYGELENTGSLDRTLVTNARNLVKAGDCIISIPEALPFIEKYSIETGQLLERFDLSDTEIFRNNLAYIGRQKNSNEKSFFVLTQDAYCRNNELFIICSRFGEQYSANTLLHLSLFPDISVVSAIVLPAKTYQSICVSDSHIYAFNSSEAKIEVFKYEN